MADHWHGWSELPLRAAPASGGAWVDLSHPLRTDLPRIGFFPEAQFRRIYSMPQDRLNVTEMQMVCHFGTHVDAPCHFIPDGPAFHEIPIDRLYGVGVLWRFDPAPYALIEPDVLEQMRPEARPGDIVLLDTGWATHFGTDRYDQNPSFSPAAAQWLVAHRVKILGVDFATPDLAVNRRQQDFDWPVHHILLSHGVLIAEHLTNLRSLPEGRVEVMCLALNIEGADGAPARVLARPA